MLQPPNKSSVYVSMDKILRSIGKTSCVGFANDKISLSWKQNEPSESLTISYEVRKQDRTIFKATSHALINVLLLKTLIDSCHLFTKPTGEQSNIPLSRTVGKSPSNLMVPAAHFSLLWSDKERCSGRHPQCNATSQSTEQMTGWWESKAAELSDICESWMAPHCYFYHWIYLGFTPQRN